MRSKILAAILLMAITPAIAQTEVVDYQYGDNKFSVKERDEMMRLDPTGDIFYQRLNSFDKFTQSTTAPYISRQGFYKHLLQLMNLPKQARMYSYNEFVPAIETFYSNINSLSKISAEDGHRYMLYTISNPVIKAVNENWGADVVDAVIEEAYLNLYEYVNMKQAGDPRYANAMDYVDMSPIKTNEKAGQCMYTVNIDEKVLNEDDIEVYFTDLALFRKIARKHPAGLLRGPITGWEAWADESEAARVMLKNYQGEKEIPAYYVYAYDLENYGNPDKIQQNLYKDNKWFVWVFRNKKLYYSYMAIPCSKQSIITVYEERKTPGLDIEDSFE